MTFNPAIPQATDLISNSQPQLLTNFGQLNTIFDEDHFTWNDGTDGGADRGLHRQVTIPVPLVADPTVTGDDAQIYTKAVAGFTEPFYANSTDAATMWYGGTTDGLVTTTVGGNKSNGSMEFPVKTKLKWGSQLLGSGIGQTVTFDSAFPTSCASVQISIIDPGATSIIAVVQQGSISRTSFGVNTSAPVTILYWAVGK